MSTDRVTAPLIVYIHIFFLGGRGEEELNKEKNTDGLGPASSRSGITANTHIYIYIYGPSDSIVHALVDRGQNPVVHLTNVVCLCLTDTRRKGF